MIFRKYNPNSVIDVRRRWVLPGLSDHLALAAELELPLSRIVPDTPSTAQT